MFFQDPGFRNPSRQDASCFGILPDIISCWKKGNFFVLYLPRQYRFDLQTTKSIKEWHLLEISRSLKVAIKETLINVLLSSCLVKSEKFQFKHFHTSYKCKHSPQTYVLHFFVTLLGTKILPFTSYVIAEKLAFFNSTILILLWSYFDLASLFKCFHLTGI